MNCASIGLSSPSVAKKRSSGKTKLYRREESAEGKERSKMMKMIRFYESIT